MAVGEYAQANGVRCPVDGKGNPIAQKGGWTCVRMVRNSCLNPIDVQSVAPETWKFLEKSANVIIKKVRPDQLGM